MLLSEYVNIPAYITLAAEEHIITIGLIIMILVQVQRIWNVNEVIIDNYSATGSLKLKLGRI
jgi:hypothetical protein